MSGDKSFFDTNVLLYMYSTAEPRKQTIAQQVFEECVKTGRMVLSTQVVQEFHAVAFRKLQLAREELWAVTTGLLDLPLVEVGPDHIRRALWGQEHYQVSFWDALILAAAEASGASLLYSEDFNHGQLYGSVRVENPFHERPGDRAL
jgi:predicted nucleic acid-binding protein